MNIVPCIMGFPCDSGGKESTCNAGDPSSNSWVGKICWRRDRPPTPVFLGFPCDSGGKESTCNAGDLGSITGLGRSLREWKGYPLQYSGLENSMDYKESRLSDFQFHFPALYSRVLLFIHPMYNSLHLLSPNPYLSTCPLSIHPTSIHLPPNYPSSHPSF